jgi:2-methylisocitrate lyase-like PEP mutase family enzyme
MPLPTADKRVNFRELHEGGCFVIPNPFDVGTAKALQHLGFEAIASTSTGFAWTIGKADNRVTTDEVCDHFAAISSAVDLPVNADFEGGFASSRRGISTSPETGIETLTQAVICGAGAA